MEVGGYKLLPTMLSGAGHGRHTWVGCANTGGLVQVGVWRLWAVPLAPWPSSSRPLFLSPCLCSPLHLLLSVVWPCRDPWCQLYPFPLTSLVEAPQPLSPNTPSALFYTSSAGYHVDRLPLRHLDHSLQPTPHILFFFSGCGNQGYQKRRQLPRPLGWGVHRM